MEQNLNDSKTSTFLFSIVVLHKSKARKESSASQVGFLSLSQYKKSDVHFKFHGHFSGATKTCTMNWGDLKQQGDLKRLLITSK